MKQLIQTYLQYSKRIAVFGIAQWAIIAVLSVAIAYFSTFLCIHISETTTDLLKTVITSSSTIAITISGGYYAHSAYDNRLKQNTNLTSESVESENSSGNG